MRGNRVVVAGACLGVVLAVAPVAAAYADGIPPDLPYSSNRCVGASPVRFAGVPWPVARTAPQRAWPLSRGAGVTVAVVDSGVSRDAPALAGAVQPGLDVVSGGAADADCLGRGTALAGIVAARPRTGTGVVGMAPEASVLPIRITDRNGRVPPGALATGIRAATSRGAGVILIGTGEPDNAGLQAAVSEAVARDVVVVAAVNDQAAATTGDAPAVWFPAAHQEVVAVAGVNVNGAASRANPAAAGVDLLAPGADAFAGGPAGEGHYRVGGAAVAAAYVAGAAALLRSYRPTLTRTQVRERLELTAEHPPGAARTATAGAGTLDTYAALSSVDPEQGTQVVSAPRDPVVPQAPPAPDPMVPRAAILGAAIAALTILMLAAISVWRRHRRAASAGAATAHIGGGGSSSRSTAP